VTATHEIEITGLDPNTKYYYKVGWEEGESPINWLKTAPAKGERNFRFVAYGDSRSFPAMHRMVINRIVELDPVFVVNSGDLVQNGHVYSQWKPQFFDPIQPLIQNTCVFTLLGNHEGNAPQYYQYLSLPKNGGNEAWWSTDIGNIHLVGLDSNESYNQTGPGSPQYEWLKQDLAATQQEWIIVAFHHPMFSFHPTRDVNQVRWDWQPLFQEMGVDVVLVGHDHHYGRTFPIGPFTNQPAKGVVHITSGGGGASLYPVHDFGYSAARRAAYNLVVFDVEGDRIVGRALDHLGNGLDSFVIDKKTPATPETFISYEMVQMEKELTDSLNTLPPIKMNVSETGVVSPAQLSTTLESRVVFGATVTASVRQGEGSPWNLTANPARVTLLPGQNLKIALTVEHEGVAPSKVFPLPQMTLKVEADLFNRDFRDPVLGFRNTDLNLVPFRVSQEAVLELPLIKENLVLDGSLGDTEWKEATQLEGFFETLTTRTPLNATLVRACLSGEDDYLAVAAQVAQSKAVVAQQPYDRPDDVYQLRNEHFTVRLAGGNSIWTFVVCPNGNSGDFEGDKSEWDATGYQAAVAPNDQGWSLEMMIPLKALPEPLSELKVNFSRLDLANFEISEWIPTYGKGRESAECYGRLQKK
jgi:hypothetical protein